MLRTLLPDTVSTGVGESAALIGRGVSRKELSLPQGSQSMPSEREACLGRGGWAAASHLFLTLCSCCRNVGYGGLGWAAGLVLKTTTMEEVLFWTWISSWSYSSGCVGSGHGSYFSWHHHWQILVSKDYFEIYYMGSPFWFCGCAAACYS